MKTCKIHGVPILRIAIATIACYIFAWLISFFCLQSAANKYDQLNSQNASSVFLYVYTREYLKSLPSETQKKIKNIPKPESPPNQETPTESSPFIWVMVRNTVTINRMSSALSVSTWEYVNYTSDVLKAITPMKEKLELL